MSKDFQLHDELKPICERYVRFAQDPVWFCRQMQLRFAELEKVAMQKRSPSGSFRAAVVEEILREGQHSRAETEAKNPMALLEEARALDAEHRPTPVVPDPRREP